jgi:transcription elongation factor Elf1
MHRYLTEHDVSCPFCGERITVLVDASAGPQQYIEDCQVCCRPFQVTVEADHGEIESLRIDSAT